MATSILSISSPLAFDRFRSAPLSISVYGDRRFHRALGSPEHSCVARSGIATVSIALRFVQGSIRCVSDHFSASLRGFRAGRGNTHTPERIARGPQIVRNGNPLDMWQVWGVNRDCWHGVRFLQGSLSCDLRGNFGFKRGPQQRRTMNAFT